jgi:probable rRNA maturation factor
LHETFPVSGVSYQGIALQLAEKVGVALVFGWRGGLPTTGLFSAPALAAVVTLRREKDFFRKLFSDAAIIKIRCPFRGCQKRTVIIFQKRVPNLTALALDRFVARARKAARLPGTVNILLTSSSEMKSLNRRFRGKDKPTDVLAFPAEPDPGISPRNQPAGEIAISAEIASHNARKLGHSPAEEVKILVLHGLLHLRGYDHECDNGEMAEREQQLRAKLYLPLGLIERTDSPSDTSKPQTRKQPQR